MYHNNRHNYTQLYTIYTLTTPILNIRPMSEKMYSSWPSTWPRRTDKRGRIWTAYSCSASSERARLRRSRSRYHMPYGLCGLCVCIKPSSLYHTYVLNPIYTILTKPIRSSSNIAQSSSASTTSSQGSCAHTTTYSPGRGSCRTAVCTLRTVSTKQTCKSAITRVTTNPTPYVRST
jgi:hypothetical protein